MLIITSKIPTKNLPIYKVLPRLIQSFFYSCLPNSEHEGYRHKSGKIFKAMNFDFALHEGELKIRYRSLNPEYEKTIAMEVLKNGLRLGEIHFVDTTVSIEEHIVNKNEVELTGFVGCAVLDEKRQKIWLEPKSSRFKEIFISNVLQKYKTFVNKQYNGIFEVECLWQSDRYKNFYYGKHKPYNIKKGTWRIKADVELINLMLSVGVGAKAMNAGMGFLDVKK